MYLTTHGETFTPRRPVPTPEPKTLCITLTELEAQMLADLLGNIGGYGDDTQTLTISDLHDFTATEMRDMLTNPLHEIVSRALGDE